MNFENVISVYPCLEKCRENIFGAIDIIENSYKNGGKLLLCGNGGSASDCEHISGELLKGFLNKRPLCGELKEKIAKNGGEKLAQSLQAGLCAIPLPSFSALSTAFNNDINGEYTFAQLTLALGTPKDVLLGISTSGSAANVRAAFAAAAALGMKTVLMTGEKGTDLRSVCDCVIAVPERETYRVQELHLPVYHFICAELEARFFG